MLIWKQKRTSKFMEINPGRCKFCSHILSIFTKNRSNIKYPNSPRPMSGMRMLMIYVFAFLYQFKVILIVGLGGPYLKFS